MTVAKRKKQPEQPRVEAEIGCRAEGPYLVRLRAWATEVEVRRHETLELVVVDFNLNPEQIKALTRELMIGAAQPRPIPGEQPEPSTSEEKPS
jgi:hypothetical protein